jgi:RNA polymerase sigma factor (sigma-70 family)
VARRGKSRFLALEGRPERRPGPPPKARSDPVSDTAAAARLEPSVSFDGSAAAAGAVVDALTGLTERQRLVLFLRYYGDLDYGQIAETLGIKPGTVAATIHQAQEHLRNRLRVAVDD